jgi:hypothetical protein
MPTIKNLLNNVSLKFGDELKIILRVVGMVKKKDFKDE